MPHLDTIKPLWGTNIQKFSLPPNKTQEKKQKCDKKQQTPRRRMILFRGVWLLMPRT